MNEQMNEYEEKYHVLEFLLHIEFRMSKCRSREVCDLLKFKQSDGIK